MIYATMALMPIQSERWDGSRTGPSRPSSIAAPETGRGQCGVERIAASIIAGFTAMMYRHGEKRRKEPPITSLETVLPRSDILKNLSSM